VGVFRLGPDELNIGPIIELLTQDGSRSIMAQKFIAEIANGDKRVLIIDGEPVPWCLARIPRRGEARGNLAAGGTGVARALTERDLQLARTVGERLAPRGLFLIGLDVIGDYVTEINVTSPTCFREIMDQTGFDVAARFAERLESRLQDTRRST
jgi:glutathione synthase